MTSLFDLTGKTALITGGNKGIGFSIAAGLAEAGADIVVVSGSIEPEGGRIEGIVKALGRNFLAYRFNLSNRTEVYKFIQQLDADDVKVDILINNAGIICESRLPSTLMNTGMTCCRLIWTRRLF